MIFYKFIAYFWTQTLIFVENSFKLYNIQQMCFHIELR